MQPASAAIAPTAMAARRNILNVNTYSKINIKQIESEIGSRTEARALVDALYRAVGIMDVGHLFIMTHVEAEHTERHVEAQIVDNKHAYTRTEIQRGLSDVGMRVVHYAVVGALEAARTAAEAESHFVEHGKAL